MMHSFSSLGSFRKRKEQGVCEVLLGDGTRQIYEGSAGSEALRFEHRPNGETAHFGGAKGEERKEKVLTAAGDAHMYEGPKGQETRIRLG